MQAFTITTVLNALLNQQELPLEDVLNRYFSPAYRQRTNGAWDDRQEFAHHARKLRELVSFASINVLDELRDGKRYATRHRVECTKRDAEEVVMEVYMFAETDDEGRFVRIEETTLMLKGREDDRDLGSAR
ncbi:nuclear transport factor 2 family protein [Cronobacter turicensis]|uniref:nuclear transport factor 2 family protein n=1 Tax=Cronobacter turicensis TaxID=413502 RepID=UPI001412BE46|nr:nuclear transport factor 2 family protein [Cronobacter turicensis]NHV09531.1 nuclear transport factor 2 family protein [Cronobacter turicensis]NHV61584.1 nuclear transport factor 2 family protein [Cronobacter turicensis]NHW08525.1 nuclear transport factor 2 family protein [Cronobacter turicensis]